MNFGLRGIVHQSIILPLQRKGARLLMKAALFLVALVALLVVIIFLTAAFFIWIDQLAGPIIAALAVAGLYFGIVIIALLSALYGGSDRPLSATATAEPIREKNLRDEDPADQEARAAVIADAIVPLLEVLRALGWKREEMALLAGAELAKTLPPLTLVGLAIVCGFLIGRLGRLPYDGFWNKPA